MKQSLRKALKAAGWSMGAITLVLAAFTGLLLFPGFLFAHKVEQGNLVAYFDGDLHGDVRPVLREIDRRLTTSEIHDTSITHRIFFGHDNRVFRALQGARSEILHRAMGIKASPSFNASWPPLISHTITFDVPDVAHDLLRRAEWPGQFNLTHILTHEVTHTLVLAKLGLANIARLPMWKAEGYPEYIAISAARSQPGYSLSASVARLLDADLAWSRSPSGEFQALQYDCIGKSYLRDENGDFWHTCYYLARVLVEYSLDRKGLTFSQLAQPAVTDLDTWRELLGAYRAGEL